MEGFVVQIYRLKRSPRHLYRIKKPSAKANGWKNFDGSVD